MVFAFAGRPRRFWETFLDLYSVPQPSGVSKPKALQMSFWAPTNGVMNLARPLCSMQRIARFSSRISWVEENCFLSPVVFQICGSIR